MVVSSPPNVPPSDAALWARASVDPCAFGDLYDRHADAVYTHCFRRTASWSVAEDLTSVVFLEAWRKRADVKLTTDSILPWLLAVANNTIRNQDRSLRRHRRLLAKLPIEPQGADLAEDVAGRLDDAQVMRDVLSVFSELTQDEQDILALCVWAGVSYADAALALGVPIGTVRSRLSRARQHLRRLLDRKVSEEGSTSSAGASASHHPLFLRKEI